MRKYSVVIPVYNRPDEIDELLDSLTRQSYAHFEVVIVEDGSSRRCDKVVDNYRDKLDIAYYYKENSGQGFSRNYGYERATGDYFVVFDSDCLVPPHYFSVVEEYLNDNFVDAYGGPDLAHEDFTDMQKAISYAMTSLYTTGGIRGRKKHMGPFHPRSFNMGISREVYEETKGYIITRMGEDIEFSIRIIKQGFKTALIGNAYVYHKRRTDWRQFYKQLHFFGRARINVSRFFPEELRLVHTFPAVFVGAFFLLWFTPLVHLGLFVTGATAFMVYFSLILMDAWAKHQNQKIAMLSVAAAFTQLFAYGIGFYTEGWRKLTKQ